MGGYRLKEIRTDNDMTQMQVADKLGVSRSTYSGWENEIDNIPLVKFNSFCELFNVDLDYASGIKVRCSKPILIKKKIDFKLIGKSLEIIRQDAGLKQWELAKEMGVSRSTYTNYKNGVTPIQTEILKTIAIKYNVSMDWIVGKKDSRNI